MLQLEQWQQPQSHPTLPFFFFIIAVITTLNTIAAAATITIISTGFIIISPFTMY